MSVSFHYVNDYFPKLARAAVRTHSFARGRGASSHNTPSSQIFQSGLASSLPTFHPDRDSASWELFVQNVPSCATAAPNNTFSCLMTASANEILAGSRAGFALNPYPFRPVIDGQGGMVSDYPEKRLARGAGGLVPFVAGTVLDEGMSFLMLTGQHAHTSTGTYFVPQQIKTELIPLFLNANYTPSPLGADALSAAVDKIISAYPDDPSAGSPYNTGNQTFGTGTGYKKAASIGTSSCSRFATLWRPAFASY
jgi:hypothetical protein